MSQASGGDGRRLLALPGIAAIVGAMLTAGVSFAILLGLTPISPDESITLTLIAINAAFILLLIGLIVREVHRIYMARTRGKAASRLHIRIVAMFALVAAIPAMLVAIIASVTLDIGLDRWFEIRTKVIINSSLSIAEAYVIENARNLQGTTLSMAYTLDANRSLYSLDRTGFRTLLSQETRGRALAHAALIRSDASVVMQADTTTEFPMPPAPIETVQTAADGLPVLIEPRTRNIVGAIVKLREIDDVYLYTIREVDAEVIRARQIVRGNTDEYRGLENNRLTTQLAFALVYLGLTLVVVLSAVWTGIAVADRLVRPIRQLIGAADEVATGNLDVSVPIRQSDGDVASLGDTFNTMILQLKSQRNELLTAKDVIDERRRFSEAVLSGVTAGVIGVEEDGTISIVNRSAEKMLTIRSESALGRKLVEVLPRPGVRSRPSFRQVGLSRAGRLLSWGCGTHLQRAGDDRGRRPGRAGHLLCGDGGRHHGPAPGAAIVRLGRCRAAHRPRNQKSAHAHSVVGGTHPPALWQGDYRRS